MFTGARDPVGPRMIGKLESFSNFIQLPPHKIVYKNINKIQWWSVNKNVGS